MHSRKIKHILILVIVITSGALVVVFWGYRYLLSNVDEQILPFESNATVKLGRIHQTATQNGVMEWSLDAESVQYANASNQASFTDPLITFFLENEKKVTLTAKKGKLDTESKDMMVSDGVTMDFDAYKLKTNTLYYEHDKRIIYSNVPVELSDDLVCIRADSMVFDIKTNKTRFKGNVEAKFRGLL